MRLTDRPGASPFTIPFEPDLPPGLSPEIHPDTSGSFEKKLPEGGAEGPTCPLLSCCDLRDIPQPCPCAPLPSTHASPPPSRGPERPGNGRERRGPVDRAWSRRRSETIGTRGARSHEVGEDPGSSREDPRTNRRRFVRVEGRGGFLDAERNGRRRTTGRTRMTRHVP